MIYVFADTHAVQRNFWDTLFPLNEQSFTENDYVLICGDFGFTMSQDNTDEVFLNVLSHLPYTILFCDGNHENFTKLNTLPIEIWNGGKVHRLRHNVIHLMRGQVFTIDNKTIFTMGGAYSIDRGERVLNKSYFLEELPSKEEYREAEKNLLSHNNRVDYIITHTAPESIIPSLIKITGRDERKGEAELNSFLEKIKNTVTYKKWFFGHWHFDIELKDNIEAVYRRVRVIGKE